MLLRTLALGVIAMVAAAKPTGDVKVPEMSQETPLLIGNGKPPCEPGQETLSVSKENMIKTK